MKNLLNGVWPGICGAPHISPSYFFYCFFSQRAAGVGCIRFLLSFVLGALFAPLHLLLGLLLVECGVGVITRCLCSGCLGESSFHFRVLLDVTVVSSLGVLCITARTSLRWSEPPHIAALHFYPARRASGCFSSPDARSPACRVIGLSLVEGSEGSATS